MDWLFPCEKQHLEHRQRVVRAVALVCVCRCCRRLTHCSVRVADSSHPLRRAHLPPPAPVRDGPHPLSACLLQRPVGRRSGCSGRRCEHFLHHHLLRSVCDFMREEVSTAVIQVHRLPILAVRVGCACS